MKTSKKTIANFKSVKISKQQQQAITGGVVAVPEIIFINGSKPVKVVAVPEIIF